jgi:hypothetical protein
MLATGPKVRRLKPGQGDGFVRVIKICSTPSFEGEVKLEAPYHKILQHIKELYWHEKDTVLTKYIISFAQILLI